MPHGRMIKLYHLRIHHSLRSTVILFSLIFFIKAVSFQLCEGKKKCLFESRMESEEDDPSLPVFAGLPQRQGDSSTLTCDGSITANLRTICC